MLTSSMAISKKRDAPLNARVAPDVHDQLVRFIEAKANDDWTKTEVVNVALHAFLTATPEERLAALTKFRSRKK